MGYGDDVLVVLVGGCLVRIIRIVERRRYVSSSFLLFM